MRAAPTLICLLVAACTSARPVDGVRGAKVHGAGVQDKASVEFHGTVLARSGWDFPVCQKCHGEDFGGGASGVTCLTCHVGGPTSCATCHGASPTSGAHRVHVLGGALLGRRLLCSECHLQPSAWDSPGHLLNADRSVVTTPAKVLFGALAQTPAEARSGPPRFEADRCTNVYCHGVTRAPSWSSAEAGSCATCHGLPPVGHPVGACASCHGSVIDAAGTLIGPSAHLDGKATLGNGDGTCNACHATLGGAHASHLGGTHKLAAPVACAECHLVPATVSSPGHFTADGFAAVFPAGSGPLARADGAAPSYARSTMKCSGTYCHGGGAALATDATPTVVREPAWVPGSGAGRCGTCHGLPPLDGVHDPAWQITQCWQCHGRSVDAAGAIVFTGGTSTHMNGVVDAP